MMEGAARQIEAALTYYDLRRYAEAEAALRKALVYEPGSATAHAWLVFALLAQSSPANPQPGRLAEALREAKAAVAADPAAALGYRAMGWVCLTMRKPDEALRAAAEILRMDPQSETGWELTSDGWLQKQEYAKALECAAAGLRTSPESLALLTNQAQALILLDRTGEARESLETVLALDPARPSAHTLRGWLAILQNDPVAAMGFFRTALRLDPLSETARRGLLAALKSRNPFYRLMVRYSLWASRFNHSEALIFLSALASVNVILGSISRVFLPLYLIYLPWRMLYGLFVDFSWISDVLFVLVLRFSPTGRVILTKEEIRASNPFALSLFYFLVNLAFGLLFWQWGYLGGMFLGLAMGLPAAAVYKMREKPRPRRIIMAVLVSLLAFFGLFAQGLLFVAPFWALAPGFFFALGRLSLPWIANLILLWE